MLLMLHESCSVGHLRCLDAPPSFTDMFSKRENFCYFLFAVLEDEIFPKLNVLLKERICAGGSKLFFSEVTPNEMGGKQSKLQSCFP